MRTVDLREGDRVALLTSGDRSYVELTLALLARGIFPVPLDPGLTPPSAIESCPPSSPCCR